MQNSSSGRSMKEMLEIQEASQPELSSYLDYRLYLSDFLQFKKNQTRSERRQYSASTFAAAANIRSPHYLHLIISGKRNLSMEMVDKFSRALGFLKLENQEFKLLVQYNQADNPTDRNHFLKLLNEARLQKKFKSGEMNPTDWGRWPDWVGWVLYALTDQDRVPTNPAEIVKMLRNQVSLDQLRRSLHNLIEQGMLSVNPSTGRFEKAKSFMESGDEIPVAVVRKLQSQLMELGLESLYRDPAEEREFGTLTLALTQSEFEDLRFQLRKLRKAAHKDNAIRRMEKKGERIYQLNLQLFPLTEK